MLEDILKDCQNHLQSETLLIPLNFAVVVLLSDLPLHLTGHYGLKLNIMKRCF